MEMKDIKVSRERIVNIFNGLVELGKDEYDPDTSYIIARNIHHLRTVVMPIIESNKQSKGFKKYTEERLRVCKALATKDKKGKPVKDNNEFIIDPNNLDKFEQRLETLKDIYKGDIEEEEDRRVKYAESIKEIMEVSVYRLPKGKINKTIKPILMEKLMEIIE